MNSTHAVVCVHSLIFVIVTMLLDLPDLGGVQTSCRSLTASKWLLLVEFSLTVYTILLKTSHIICDCCGDLVDWLSASDPHSHLHTPRCLYILYVRCVIYGYGYVLGDFLTMFW